MHRRQQHQLRMRDAVEIAAQIRVYHLRVAGVQQAVHRSYRVMGSPIPPVGVLLRRQVRSEDRLQHQQCRRLHDAVSDCGYAQGTQFVAVSLGYPDPLDRLRFVGLRPQPVCQFPKPAALPVLRDVLEPLAVYPRCTLVGLATSISKFQHVSPVHLVVQQIEPKLGFILRFGMQRALQLLHR